jgi:hypothetical protein
MVGLLGVLTPAAYAEPSDPTWLGGYWDDGDFDTAVDFLTSTSAISVPLVTEADPVLVPIVRSVHLGCGSAGLRLTTTQLPNDGCIGGARGKARVWSGENRRIGSAGSTRSAARRASRPSSAFDFSI